MCWLFRFVFYVFVLHSILYAFSFVLFEKFYRSFIFIRIDACLAFQMFNQLNVRVYAFEQYMCLLITET